MTSWTINEADHGKRFDIFLSAQYPQYARSALKILFNQDKVSRNGETGHIKAGTILKTNDHIEVDDKLLFTVPPDIDLPVLYQDDDFIVVNKPVGVLSHAKGSLLNEATVASFLGKHYRLTGDEQRTNRSGIVHRLDRATSGVMLAAKHREAQHWMQAQFSKRNVKKVYVALAEGIVEPPEAVIDAPISRNPKRPQTFMTSGNGKSAQTKYKTLAHAESPIKGSVLKLMPLTGRTHQLRVHLASLNHPIYGDHLYGHEADRLFLHAYSLEVTLPSGSRQIITAPLPSEFLALLPATMRL